MWSAASRSVCHLHSELAGIQIGKWDGWISDLMLALKPKYIGTIRMHPDDNDQEYNCQLQLNHLLSDKHGTLFAKLWLKCKISHTVDITGIEGYRLYLEQCSY
jgi:hypothetical protein